MKAVVVYASMYGNTHLVAPCAHHHEVGAGGSDLTGGAQLATSSTV